MAERRHQPGRESFPNPANPQRVNAPPQESDVTKEDGVEREKARVESTEDKGKTQAWQDNLNAQVQQSAAGNEEKDSDARKSEEQEDKEEGISGVQRAQEESKSEEKEEGIKQLLERIYRIALKEESSDALAKVLGAIGIAQVNWNEYEEWKKSNPNRFHE